MYTQSQLTGEIRNESGEVIPQDDRFQLWQYFHQWKINGGILLEVPFFEGEQNEKLTSKLTEEIAETVDYLTTRALSSSIGKSGSRSYLESQKLIYQEKYNVATGIVVNSAMVQTITDEMNRDYPTIEDLDSVLISYGITPTGTKLERFYLFIIFRFESGLSFYQFFISLVEDFRTCSLTHVENNRFDKTRLVIDFARALPVQITQAELIVKRNEMLAL